MQSIESSPKFKSMDYLNAGHGEMSVFESNVRKELTSMKSGTRAVKFDLIKKVLEHVPELKSRTKHAADQYRLDALCLMPFDPVKTPAPLIADVAFDLAKILRDLTPSEAHGPCDVAVDSFLRLIAVAEERAQYMSKDHLVGLNGMNYASSSSSSSSSSSNGKFKSFVKSGNLVVPLTHEAKLCPCCQHNSAMAVMTPEEIEVHNDITAAKFNQKFREWEALGTGVGRPRRSGELAVLTTPLVCQCVHLRCPANIPSCTCPTCSCQCNYQFFADDENSRHRSRRKNHFQRPPVTDVGELAAKRKRAWFEASAARDALIESKEQILDKTEKELKQLKASADDSDASKIERLKVRVSRLARELKALEDDEYGGKEEENVTHAI